MDPTAISEDDLKDAIRATLGDSVFEAVDGASGLVAAHERACMKAFLAAEEGERVEILRASMRHLNSTGRYPFYDAPGARP